MKNINNVEASQEALVEWVHRTSKTLPSESRALFHFLCAIKEDDRNSNTANPKWEDIWPLFGVKGEFPTFESALSPLLDLKIIDEISQENNQFKYVLDPIVANTGLNEINRDVLRSIYAEMSTSWIFQCMWIFDLNNNQLGDKTILLQVAMKAIFYCHKMGRWEPILPILQSLTNRDLSPEVAKEILPLVREAVKHTEGTSNELSSLDLLVRVLSELGQYDESEEINRSLIVKYINEREYGSAFYQSKFLTLILLQSDRDKDALATCRMTLQYGYLAEKYDKWPETRIVDVIPRYLAIAESHYYMAVCLENCGMDSIPHFFVASIILSQVGSEDLDFFIRTIAKIIQRSESPYYGLLNLPQSFSELCQMVNEIKDVDFNSLFEKLPQHSKNGDTAFKLVFEKILALCAN